MNKLAAGLAALLPFVASGAYAANSCGPATVQIVVLDANGNAVAGLSPSDFRVKIKGQTANIAAVNYGVVPHSTLLLISRAASMQQASKVQVAREVARAVVNGAPGTVTAATVGGAVSGFADARTTPVDLQLNEDPHTVLYDAMFAGLASLHPHRGDAVVLITDSADSGSQTNAAEMQQRMSSSGVQLFVVALPPVNNRAALQSLADLGESTGGAFFASQAASEDGSNVDAIVSAFTRMYAQYTNVYQLETSLDGQDRALPLRVEVDRKKLGGGRVVAPAMLAPCSAQ